jgi:anthranilate phosphoribosyltransferase
MTSQTLLTALQAVVNEARTLSMQEAEEAMSLILLGKASDVQIAALVTALRMRGESVEEIAGFAKAMRAAAEPIEVSLPLLDTCGTGGDGCDTFNISTTAAFVIAGAGVRVAKHGNRGMTSRCGSADMLEALGVRIDQPAEAIARHGIGFLFAQAFHPAMRNVATLRKEIKSGHSRRPRRSRSRTLWRAWVWSAVLWSTGRTGWTK